MKKTKLTAAFTYCISLLKSGSLFNVNLVVSSIHFNKNKKERKIVYKNQRKRPEIPQCRRSCDQMKINEFD